MSLFSVCYFFLFALHYHCHFSQTLVVGGCRVIIDNVGIHVIPVETVLACLHIIRPITADATVFFSAVACLICCTRL